MFSNIHNDLWVADTEERRYIEEKARKLLSKDPRIQEGLDLDNEENLDSYLNTKFM